jgi:hypothetical protein
MTVPVPRPTTAASFRLPAWLLILSILGFVAVIATYSVIFTPAGIGDFTAETPEAIRGVTTGWVIARLVFAVAFAFCCVGYLFVDRRLLAIPAGRPWAIVSIVIIVVDLVVVVVGEALAISILDSTAATLAGDQRWMSSVFLGGIYITLSFLALTATSIALSRSGVLPRLGLVVAAIAGLISVVGILSTLGVTPVPAPPPLLGILGIVLGVGLLRRPRADRVSPAL